MSYSSMFIIRVFFVRAGSLTRSLLKIYRCDLSGKFLWLILVCIRVMLTLCCTHSGPRSSTYFTSVCMSLDWSLVEGSKILILDMSDCFCLCGFAWTKTCQNLSFDGSEDQLLGWWVHVTIMSSTDANPSWSHLAMTATTLLSVTMTVARALRVLSQLRSISETDVESRSI